VAQYSKDYKYLIKIWKSKKEAGEVLGFSQSNIGPVARGERKSAYGYGWAYI